MCEVNSFRVLVSPEKVSEPANAAEAFDASRITLATFTNSAGVFILTHLVLNPKSWLALISDLLSRDVLFFFGIAEADYE